VVKYLPAVGAALLGIIVAIGATRPARDFICDRTTCTYGDGVSFRVTDVREVRFVDGFGKNKTQAESQIVLASGHQLSIGRADTDVARNTHQELQYFFSPAGPPTYERKGSRGHWLWLLAGAAWIAAIVLGVKAHREPETYRSPEQEREGRRNVWKKVRKYAVVILGAVVAIGGAQLALMFIASRVQGTLILECKQRCRFQGMECLPGGSSRQTLDEGTYDIEVWSSSGSALWTTKSFQITTGETTTFVCQ
jgi:hypothetical protein